MTDPLQTIPPAAASDSRSPTGTKRRLRANALTPEFAVEAFVDRACDAANPDAGLFAIAASLAMLVRAISKIHSDEQAQKEKETVDG